jgi:hypothetical protein
LETRAPTRQIAAIKGHGYIVLNASTRRKRIRVILDSNIQKNFISLETIRQLNVPIREKEKPYLFNIIDRTAIEQDKGIVKYKTVFIRVKIGKHIEEISLDIVKISNY